MLLFNPQTCGLVVFYQKTSRFYIEAKFKKQCIIKLVNMFSDLGKGSLNREKLVWQILTFQKYIFLRLRT